MKDRYRLGDLKNVELLAGLSALVARQNELTGDLLAHLAELDERRLHLELGYASLFAYCTESLGLSEPAAGRRIAAARVCRKFPEAFGLVAQGELHLSALCALGSHLSASNASELFGACRRKTRRQIDELLAARFPAPDVREQIRRLPNRASVAPVSIATEQPTEAEIPNEISNAPVPPPPTAPRMQPQRQTIEPRSAGRFGIHFTAGARLREKIEQARALASHRLPSGDLAGLLDLALDALIRDLEKQRFAIGRKPRSARTSAERKPEANEELSPGESATAPRPPKAQRKATRAPRRTRAAVARQVYLRDQGQCAFVSVDGRRCTARAFLELDHIKPWAEGGAPTVENLRLCCRAHNQHLARAHFGNEVVEAGIARASRASRTVSGD